MPYTKPSPNRYRVRPARHTDASVLAALCGQLGYGTSEALVNRRLSDICSRDEETVLVAELPDNGVHGFIHVFSARRLTADPFAELGGLVVDEPHRSGGVGGMLLASAEDWARAHGMRRLRVRMRVTREDALAFYRATGFQETKVQAVLAKDIAEESTQP